MPVDPGAAAAPPATGNWPFHPAPPGQWQPPRQNSPPLPPGGTAPRPSLTQLAEQASAPLSNNLSQNLSANVSKDTLIAAIRNSLALTLTVSGRTARAEYWYFAVAACAVSLLATALGSMDESSGTPFLLLALLVMIPGITASIRRLHDTDRSGAWLLLNFVPLGFILVIYWLAQPGQWDANRFGPPPGSPPA